MSRQTTLKVCAVALLTCAVLGLAGCGVSSTEELKAWIEKEHKLLGAATTPFVATRIFEPKAYTLADGDDPFDPSRVSGVELPGADKVETAAKPSGATPDFSGQKQALENFPLESLQVKGILSQEGVQVALVWAGDRLHQVRQGDYMGTRRGKVLQISTTAVVVSELVQDASGQWKPKNTVLPVKEGEK